MQSVSNGKYFQSLYFDVVIFFNFTARIKNLTKQGTISYV